MKLSVVLPTYNRSAKLGQCLAALAQQTLSPSQFEVVVVNDGSTDDTAAYLASLEMSYNVTVLTQKNSGQATARNKGIKAATGEVIVLIGDDIYLEPECLEKHLALHKKHPQKSAAVLGFVTWLPTLPISNLMRFMEKGKVFLGKFGGHQFAYDLLEGNTIADYRFFYTANISLKRELLLKFPFDETFHGYGWEDIELGLRLTQKAGLTLYYEPHARGFHDHLIDMSGFTRRMEQIGSSIHLMQEKFPEMSWYPTRLKKMILRAISSVLSRPFFKPIHEGLHYYGISKKHFLKGLK